MAARSLRRQIFAIAVASILPLAVLSAAIVVLVYMQQRDAEQRRTLETTRALASAVDSELKRLTSGVQSLAAAIEQDDVELASFYELAQRALQRQPQWRSLIIADEAGRQVAHSEFKPGEAIPANPEPASVQAALKAGKPVIGNLILGRTGWAFAVRIPIRKSNGARYVLSAILGPDSIRAIVERQRVSADWVISVFDANGVRVARSTPDQLHGTRGGPSLLKLMDPALPEGIGVTTTMEGREVFTAFARAPESGWTVVMGLPQALLIGPALRTTSLWALALALSIIGGLAAAFALARRIQEREALLARESAAREAAEDANRAKDQFLAMLGHELRNPIAAISNAAQLIDHGGADPQLAHRARDIVKRQVAHLARLTDDLLDAARAILGKVDLRTEPVDLAAAAGNALASLAASGRNRGHTIVTDLEQAWVRGDAMRLEQVISNLLVNAVKYTPDGGTIHVTSGLDGEGAFVRVADNGVGMSAELAAKAFDLFVQGRRDIDRSQGGLGIGLTLVRRLAELHGGTAEVASEGEGHGTTFTVRIPATEPPPMAPQKGSAAPERALTVLIVEDNDDARETLQALLEMKGHRVATARDGISGLEKGLALAPDLAIVDLGLPGLDGYEVARRMRGSSLMTRTYLVALTGYGTADAREKALASGFDEHLTKPLDLQTLEAILARLAAAAPA